MDSSMQFNWQICLSYRLEVSIILVHIQTYKHTDVASTSTNDIFNRLGWCLHPPHLTDTYRGVHDQMVAMAPHPMQYASISYLNLPSEYFTEELPVRYKHRIEMLVKALKEAGFRVIKPDGAYYLFVDYSNVEQLKGLGPMDAAMYLMEKVGVACVPGDNFYGKSLDGQRMLRFAACRSVSDIESAIKRLKVLNQK